MGRTLFEKLWSRNEVLPESREAPAILYVSLHLLHEITAPQAFDQLNTHGLKVRRKDLTLATVDHCAPTSKDAENNYRFPDQRARIKIDQLIEHCKTHGIPCLKPGDSRQGIVHVIGPELGLTRPGSVIVCGDSHTSTHGAFGTIAFGIGSSEVAQVLATQCILQRKPKNFSIRIDGKLPDESSAKDLSLHMIAMIGSKGGQGYAIEYGGTTIEAMSMEERLTLCNMTIECGSRFGLIRPDQKTWEYLRNTPYGQDLELEDFVDLYSDSDAHWDRVIEIDASQVAPRMTYGTSPDMSIPVGSPIPIANSETHKKALEYMGWKVDNPSNRRVDFVFVGSCTNGRISDLRLAAKTLSGHKVAKTLECIVVPGSAQVKKQAEAEGLDRIFLEAGARWGEPSCSLCNAMNGDYVPRQKLAVSTSNRNFEGRQGPGSQTILASPETAMKVAIKGALL